MDKPLIDAMSFEPIPENFTPLEGILIVKVLDDDGEVTWFSRYTENLNSMEALGMLTAERQILMDLLMEGRTEG